MSDELRLVYLQNSGYLPTGIKQMIVSKLLTHPFEILNVDCDNLKLKELVCHNLELLKTLWYKYVSSKLPKNANKSEMGGKELYDEYKKIINIYKQDVIKTLETSKKLENEDDGTINIKGYDVLYNNFKNVEKINKKMAQYGPLTSENESKVLNLLEKINYYDFIFANETLLSKYIFNDFEAQVFKLLLEKGANPNFEDYPDFINHKYAPLISVTVIENYDLVKILLEYGADPNTTDYKGTTPLMIACKRGYIKIIKLLLSKTTNNHGPLLNINQKDDKGETVLMKISKKEDHQVNNLNEVMKLLVKNDKIQIDLEDKNGETALFYAIKDGEYSNGKILLKYGANPNKKNKEGKTPIMLTPYIKSLIKYGANINEKDNEGKTALIIACEKQSYIHMQWLLKFNPDVNIQDNYGNTALIYLCNNKNKDESDAIFLIKQLLKHIPNLNIKNNNNEDVFDISIKNNFTQILTILMKYQYRQ